MHSYETARLQYRPDHIKILLIAESPPPPAKIKSSRQFYYTDRIRKDDRLFTNTIRAIYPSAISIPEAELQQDKKQWLRQLKSDGIYMIEALEDSQIHSITKQQRQDRIHQNLPQLIERVRSLAASDTKIILIKSNVFDVVAEPLRAAGFNVLNTELVDYPGRYNQGAYREKITRLLTAT